MLILIEILCQNSKFCASIFIQRKINLFHRWMWSRFIVTFFLNVFHPKYNELSKSENSFVQKKSKEEVWMSTAVDWEYTTVVRMVKIYLEYSVILFASHQ